MLLAGVAAIVLLRYFATGQVVAAKSRQLHALDAAAYSGALVQARALNMLAYLNRAQVGHQIAMAHLVTLGSWASLGDAQSRQLASGNPPAYLIAMLFGPEHGASYAAARRAAGLDSMTRDGEGALARAYAAHDDIVRRVFAKVQEDIVQGLPDARWAAMQSVLAQNYPGARPSQPAGFDLVLRDDTWPGYVQRYTAQPWLRPFVQRMAEAYQFLSRRNHTASNAWTVSADCPSLRHQLRRRGATELDATGRWHSIDTESFHALRGNRWIGCYYREYPMGWGWISSAAHQIPDAPFVANPPDNFSAQDFWRWVQDATNWDILSTEANPLANSRAVANRKRWQGGGLPNYFDLGTARANGTLSFAVHLRHPGPEGLTVTTHSAAETFFARPEPRADAFVEGSNLFHPYWQARLADSDSALVESGRAP
jgi:hypothetical protein